MTQAVRPIQSGDTQPSAPAERASGGSRLLVPGCGIALLALFCVLYATDTAAYTRILTWLMGRPFPRPFVDWEWFPSAVECWQRGIDVYIDNPCYLPIAHGRHIYPPLWLRLTFLPYGEKWVAPFGLGIGALFFASLAALTPPRRATELCVTLLATFSSFTAYAIERGNADVILFMFTVAGVICWTGRLPCRLAGYGLFILAGLLKFYPFVLLILALRERPRVFAGVCAATLAVLAAYGLAFYDELGRIHGIPGGEYFADRFASVNLPYGLFIVATDVAHSLGGRFGWRFHEAPLFTVYLPSAFLLMLTLAAVVRAARLTRRLRLDTPVTAMPQREAGLLVAGALLICGCFFTGQSNGYRAVMLLLTLPGLLRLARCQHDRAARMEIMATCWAIVFVMWTITIQQILSSLNMGGSFLFDHWLITEIGWWWIVSVLLAVLLGFLREAQTLSFLSNNLISLHSDRTAAG